MTATPPSTPHFPGYTISRHLARGGMAEVYVADQVTLRQQGPKAYKPATAHDAYGLCALLQSIGFPRLATVAGSPPA